MTLALRSADIGICVAVEYFHVVELYVSVFWCVYILYDLTYYPFVVFWFYDSM